MRYANIDGIIIRGYLYQGNEVGDSKTLIFLTGVCVYARDVWSFRIGHRHNVLFILFLLALLAKIVILVPEL